jgi:hypothetical protein
MDNVCDRFGGGLYCVVSDPVIRENVFINNQAGESGGGVRQSSGDMHLTRNTFYGNRADPTAGGGGIYLQSYDSTITNCIFWDNFPNQIDTFYLATPEITYCNIQDGWTGLGNINDDPLFVDPEYNDYRLQWGSPCIDTGDPDPQYNDPDGTRADMGAFYYDQSTPVRILLTSLLTPFLIQPSGGTVSFFVRITNCDNAPQEVLLWCDVTLPDSSNYGPLIGPVTITIQPSTTIERVRAQTVPGYAPLGIYHYNAYAVVGADTSKDSFMFGKLGIRTDGNYSGWGNCGEPLDGPGPVIAHHIQPTKFALNQNYPNPFNASTVISYQLPVVSHVNLAVYDVAGRQVAELVNGWREAGRHEVTFDASGLPSGVYIYWLESGEYTASGKMVLMK